MRPPPGLMANPAPPPVGKVAGKGGAGPLADSLAETRRRVEDIETAIKSYENDNEAQVQIETQAHQIAVMEAKFALLEAQMKSYEDDPATWVTQAHQIAAMEAKIVLLEHQIQFENHASFAICNEMKEQMTHMENRIISLEAASNSASLASSTAADYEVLQNPALLNPKSSGL